MSEGSHADHRPRVDLDPAEAAEGAPTMMGRFYPLNDILAVIHDRAAAERAVEALKEAGVPDGDMDLLDGAWFAEAVRGRARRHGAASRLAALLPTDESLLVRRYVAEAERGHHIVVVHAAQPADVERARQVLSAHGAHEMRHYGRHVITDL